MEIRGSSFLSDMVDDISAVATQDLDDMSEFDQIVAKFQELIDQSIIGDVVEAWHLFNWLKMEKKVFNNIEWERAYTITSIGGLTDIYTWVSYRFTGQAPDIDSSDTERTSTPTFGLHFREGSSAYLELPLDVNFTEAGAEVYALGLNEAIDLTKEYIPSWLEVYATYVGTGDYELANELYKFYTNENKFKLKVAIYQITTITDEEVTRETEEKKFYVKIDDGEKQEISESEFEEYKKQAEEGRGLFAWLGDLINDFIDAIKDIIEEIAEWISDILGFYITVDTDWIGVVEDGNAYDYKIKQTYNIGFEELEAVAKEPKTKRKNEVETFDGEKTERYRCSDGRGGTTTCERTVEVTYELTAETYASCEVNLKTWKNVLVPVSVNVTQYDEKTRYRWAIGQIVEEHRLRDDEIQYNEDDVAIADEVITAYYSQEYGLVGGASVRDFVAAGDTNESVVNFAAQFNGKKLAYMMAIDDTNTFWANEWCAMFVSYCMKKASVPVTSFSSCSVFWNQCKSKPGFYDISGSKNGGYITSDPNHIATYKQIQPGDILLFRWDGATTPRSHTGICKSVEKDASGNVTSITVIEGNTGSGGYNNTKVSIKTYNTASMKNIVSFVSISKVIAENERGNSW